MQLVVIVRCFLVMTMLGVLTTSGCGDPPPPTGTVKGTLKLDGKPYTKGLNIYLIDHSKGTPAAAVVDENGDFVIEEPVLTGDYVAYVAPIAPPDPTDGSPPAPVKFDPAIPERYRNDLNTDLKLEVKEGENVADFNMTK